MPSSRTTEATPAVGYIRVSMGREEMISPELQRSAITKWAKANRRRIVTWIEDLDVTGRTFKRKVMKAISYVEDGTAEEIVVWKYSRFGRNRHGNAINIERVERAGGQLESATEQVDARTAVGRLNRGILFELAAFESDRTGEQWAEAHTWRREHGLPATGRKRFGYIWYPRKLPQLDGTIVVQPERYEPDPAFEPVIEDLYGRYISGTGFTGLAMSLNEVGVTTVYGNLWGDRALAMYMDAGFAAGYLRVHDPACKEPYRWGCPRHHLIRGAHKPIIDHDTWQAYLRRRAQVKATAPRARTAVYTLSGLTKCVRCMGSAKRAYGDPRYIFYTCSNRRRKGAIACPGISMGAPRVEADLLEWLKEVADGIDHEADARLAVEGEPSAPDRARRRAAAEAELVKAERAIRRHMRAYATADEDDPDGSMEAEYRSTLVELRERKAAALRDVEGFVVDGVEEAAAARMAAIPVAAGLLADWDSLEPARVNVMLRQVIRHVVIGEGEIAVVPVWAPAA